MPREVDKRKTSKALRRLKRAAERAEAGEGASPLNDWEKEFVAGVTQRLETYGSAFRDPSKGHLEEALSARQTQVTRAIEKKTQPKRKAVPGETEKVEAPRRRASFKSKRPPSRARVRDINEDAAEPSPPEAAAPVRPPLRARPSLKVIPGGRQPRPAGEQAEGEDGS
jgi:hypothetical protein